MSKKINYWALMLDCGCHNPGEVAVYQDPHRLYEALSREHGNDYAADALLCSTPVAVPDDFCYGSFASRAEAEEAIRAVHTTV